MNHQNSSKWLIQAVSALAIQLVLLQTIAYPQVTTSQYDNQRTGATLNETLLTSRNVNREEFGKLGEFKVDGAVYAQPLFLPAVEVPGKGTHDILFIATEHDSVYAFDAYRTTDLPLWHVSLLDKKKGETPVSCAPWPAPSFNRKWASLPLRSLTGKQELSMFSLVPRSTVSISSFSMRWRSRQVRKNSAARK